MNEQSVEQTPVQIGFFLVPDFSMMAFTSALEPLRLANWVSGRELYDWCLFSRDGGPVRGSNGARVQVDRSIAESGDFPAVYVCGGIEVQRHADAQVLAWLRRLDRHGSDVGALCTGAYLLARAGLLDNHRCTIHWENLPGLAEEFPQLEVTTEIYEIDGNRMTCSGGTAALDMMLYLISLRYGADLVTAICDELIYEHIREGHDQQRKARRLYLGNSHPKLLEAISQMEDNLEQPLSQTGLAGAVGISTRQIERLFRRHLDRTPTRFYLELRLHRARLLLRQTNLSVLNVALACGFASASHFSKCYREHFGHTPRNERRQPA